MHNPFGNRRIDVAHETISNGLLTLATELGEIGNHLPTHFTGRPYMPEKAGTASVKTTSI